MFDITSKIYNNTYKKISEKIVPSCIIGNTFTFQIIHYISIIPLKNTSSFSTALPFPQDAHTITRNQEYVFSGTLITVRDGTLAKIFSEYPKKDQGALLSGKMLYFCGPTPAPEGEIIGSCGPTTSSRMEPYFKKLASLRIRGCIGKGDISETSRSLLEHCTIPYLFAVGGSGAYASSCVLSSEVIALEELGAEAVYSLEMKDFPVFS